MQVFYEWAFEAHDDSGEIADVSFEDKLTDLQQDGPGDLVLVRNEGSESAGVTDRVWAYVKDGKLPECFSDAMNPLPQMKVPQRFHAELKAYLNH